MAVVIKVRISRTQTEDRTHYDYPEEYEASKIQVISYETSQLVEKYDEVVARGNDHEFLIGVVKDIDAPSFLASKYITELTDIEANVLGETWLEPIVKTTDQNMVNAALAKYATGGELTLEEEKALDPNDAAPGLIMSKSFTERLSDTLTDIIGKE